MDLDSRTEEQVRLLADSSNRTVLNILDEAGKRLHVKELADRLVDRDVSIIDSARYDDQLERTLIALHHERLPKLAEVDLIEYDPEENLAAYRPDTEPNVTWENDATIDALIEHIPTSHTLDGEGIGVLRGRESAIQYGRKLADEAEEELFCMYVDTNLLGDECIRRAKDASERDVTIYVGSQDPGVRELTRKHLPEATLWEPQLDWMNTLTSPRVGRLILVDRRKVMLAILEEPIAEESRPGEIAFVGEGEENPLVVLVRDLLGPRIDHLDYQSEDFRKRLSS